MKDPDRLLESSDSDLERLLLRAGRERAPRGAKRRALAAATGVVAATTLTAGNATGAALAGKATAGVTTFVSLKWIVIVSVASVSVAAGTVAVRTTRASRAQSAPVEMPRSSPARPRAPSAAPRPRSPPSVAAPPSAPPAAAPAMTAPAIAAPAVTAPLAPAISAVVRTPPASAKPIGATGSTSAAELAMLDQARGAIDDGDAARGLSVLDAYASRFPHGIMGPEASILRIEALANAGQRAAAKREADAFLKANPTSPYAPRIQSLVGTSNP